jgi:hypothetical protein
MPVIPSAVLVSGRIAVHRAFSLRTSTVLSRFGFSRHMRFSSQIISALLPTLLCSQLSACGWDPFGLDPDRLDGTYALRSFDGREVPVTLSRGAGEEHILVADTLRFSPNGTVARSVVFRHVSATAVPRDTVYHSRLRYGRTSNRLRIEYPPCPPNANCIGAEEGRIAGARLTISRRIYTLVR